MDGPLAQNKEHLQPSSDDLGKSRSVFLQKFPTPPLQSLVAPAEPHPEPEAEPLGPPELHPEPQYNALHPLHPLYSLPLNPPPCVAGHVPPNPQEEPPLINPSPGLPHPFPDFDDADEEDWG